MSEKLKPCYCGYEVALSGMDHGAYFSLSCPECKREVSAFTMGGLVESWNKPKSAEPSAAPEAEPVEVVTLISDVGVDYLKSGYGVTVHGERWRHKVALVGKNPIPLMTVAQHNRIMAAAPQHDAELIELLRADNEALARNLKGKHALTGATYEHLISERDRLKGALARAVAEAVADELDPWYANAVSALKVKP